MLTYVIYSVGCLQITLRNSGVGHLCVPMLSAYTLAAKRFCYCFPYQLFSAFPNEAKSKYRFSLYSRLVMAHCVRRPLCPLTSLCLLLSLHVATLVKFEPRTSLPRLSPRSGVERKKSLVILYFALRATVSGEGELAVAKGNRLRGR